MGTWWLIPLHLCKCSFLCALAANSECRSVQVAGRCTVLWLVVETYQSSGLSPFYGLMVLAWSAADTIRYLYFATRLVGGHQYYNLTWLRYSAFYVLYPLGIASEVGVVYETISEAFALGYNTHAWSYIAAATLYIPGECVCQHEMACFG